MTPLEFSYRREYKKKEQLREIQLVRRHATIMANYAGFGSKRWIAEREIWPHPILDETHIEYILVEEDDLKADIANFLKQIRKDGSN